MLITSLTQQARSGQPPVIENKRTWKDTLYAGFFASGDLLHPVLFTSDKNDTVQSSEEMRVVYQQHIKGPGTLSTETWWNIVGKIDFPDGGIVMVDHLRGHFSKTLIQEMQDLDVEILYYPKYAGALVDPCDNSWFADLKHRYYQKDRSDHGLMIRAIRESIYETDERTLEHYWHHCGYTSDAHVEDVAASLASEGYDVQTRYETEYSAMREKYAAWSKAFANHLKKEVGERSSARSTKNSQKAVLWSAHKRP